MAPPRSQTFNRRHLVVVNLPDPGGANADIANFKAMRAPQDLTIISAALVPLAVWVAAAPANDATVALKRNNTGTAICSLAVQTALAQGSYNDMGALDATTKQIPEGGDVTCDITTNGTADAPAQTLHITYEYDVR